MPPERDYPSTKERLTPEEVSLRDDSPAVGYAPDGGLVPDLDAFYTYADYLRMQLVGRWELIKGYLREMSAPRDPHQRAVQAFGGDLRTFLKAHPCTSRVAPYDVRLFGNHPAHDSTVVQPDVCVICDRGKITARGCVGAPDFIIEVLSPSTSQHDRLTKTVLYEQAGVREYWIVDLRLERIEQRVLAEDARYSPPTLSGRGASAASHVIAGFSVSVAELMDEANEFADVGDGEEW